MRTLISITFVYRLSVWGTRTCFRGSMTSLTPDAFWERVGVHTSTFLYGTRTSDLHLHTVSFVRAEGAGSHGTRRVTYTCVRS